VKTRNLNPSESIDVIMANLTVKDLPDSLYEKLKSQAHANRRSIASEVTVLLERALGERATPEEELLQRAKRLRDRTPTRLTEERRREALRRGRA
jgi:plasmid stability protein